MVQTLQFDLAVGPEIHVDLYHVAVVRTLLTRNLGARFPDVQDEITGAFVDYIPAKNGKHIYHSFRLLAEDF